MKINLEHETEKLKEYEKEKKIILKNYPNYDKCKIENKELLKKLKELETDEMIEIKEQMKENKDRMNDIVNGNNDLCNIFNQIKKCRKQITIGKLVQLEN